MYESKWCILSEWFCLRGIARYWVVLITFNLPRSNNFQSLGWCASCSVHFGKYGKRDMRFFERSILIVWNYYLNSNFKWIFPKFKSQRDVEKSERWKRNRPTCNSETTPSARTNCCSFAKIDHRFLNLEDTLFWWDILVISLFFQPGKKKRAFLRPKQVFVLSFKKSF